jgi:hypothetical protein
MAARTRWLGVAVLVLAVTCGAAPQLGPRIGREKKLIKWGMDTPDSEEYRTRLKEFESWPFDGYVINADARIDGKKAWLHGQMSSTYPFTYEHFRHMVTDFRAVRSKKITDNFLRVATAADPLVFVDAAGKEVGRDTGIMHPDWFNDAEFGTFVANWTLLARIARECGMKGLFLDFEQWSHTNGKYPRPWEYLFLREHNGGQIPSFAEHQAKYRERGRQLAQALCREFPDIVLFSYMTLQQTAYDNLPPGPYPDPTLPPLAYSPCGLLPAFLDGILEGIPADSKAVLVDGGPMYHANLNQRFADYRLHTFRDNFAVSEAPPAAKEHMRLAFAVWIDGRGWRGADWGWHWNTTPPYWNNQFTPQELEYAFYYALLNADKYAWVWSEEARCFADCGQKLRGPRTVNDDYRRALERVRTPHRLDFRRDPRGADTDPLPPKAATQPGHADAETFAPLATRYDVVQALPTTWKFCVDPENIGIYPISFMISNWNLNGYTVNDWPTIETGEYYENLGYRFNGHAYYRVDLTFPQLPEGRKAFIQFAGIASKGFGIPEATSMLWVNNTYCPAEMDLPEGCTVRSYEVTKALKAAGQTNTIVLQICDYGGPGGVYKRGVRLVTAKP